MSEDVTIQFSNCCTMVFTHIYHEKKQQVEKKGMQNVPLISKRSSKESKVKDKVGEDSDGSYQRTTAFQRKTSLGK